MRRFIVGLAALTIVGMACGPKATGDKIEGGPSGDSRPADLIVRNAQVWTGDERHSAAEAFAIRGGRFVRVGSNTDMDALRGPTTRMVDAHGRRVIPGICDAHLHLLNGGLQLSRISLREVGDRAAFVEAVRQYSRGLPAGRWMLGGRWSTESWPDPAQPTKEWIDPVTGDRPVLLSRMDGHEALANSAALRIAGINRDGPADPVGGLIERDPSTHEPTGILKDAALDLFDQHIPAPSADEMREALKAAMREANRHGVTCVHTMSPWSDTATIQKARDMCQLTLRIRVYVSESDWSAWLKDIGAFVGSDKSMPCEGNSADWVRICGFKEFADGSLGSRTAYMAAPFNDQPDNRGLARAVMQGHALADKCRMAVDNDLGTAIHAIGDQANHDVLDAYESVLKGTKQRPGSEHAPPRMRIEHAQHLLPADINRFARLGVVASMQPLHKADDGRYAEKAIGTERCRTSYAFRSLLDAGAPVAFGSDWPVVSLNPFLGIHAAVTGKTLDGRTFVPEQNISVEQALTAYTRGGAHAAGDDNRLGQIRSGFLADFVILEDDVLTMPHDAVAGVRIAETFVNGHQVWP